MWENEGMLEACMSRLHNTAWQARSPCHSKQTNFHEVRFHETAVLSFNCSGIVHGKITSSWCVVTLSLREQNGTRARDPSKRTWQRWCLFKMQTVRGFVKHRKRGSILPLNRSEWPTNRQWRNSCVSPESSRSGIRVHEIPRESFYVATHQIPEMYWAHLIKLIS